MSDLSKAFYAQQFQEPDPPFQQDSLKYVEGDNSVCPQCGSDDVNWGDPEPEGETIFRGADCNRCGLEWVERYCLTGLEDDLEGRNVLAFNLHSVKGAISLGEDGLILHLDGQKPVNILQLVALNRRMVPVVDVVTGRGWTYEHGSVTIPASLFTAMHEAVEKFDEEGGFNVG